MEKHYTSEKNVRIVIALLKAHGISKIIASPGTTNMTFVGSIQNALQRLTIASCQFLQLRHIEEIMQLVIYTTNKSIVGQYLTTSPFVV